MAWFKVDSCFYSSPRVLSIPKAERFAAIGVWALMGSWCVRHKTNGLVPEHIVKEVANATPKQVMALIRSGLWEEVPGGYKFHQWRKSQDGDYRRNIPKSVRQAVMERDGFKCVFCGDKENLSLDHIIPYRLDGPDTLENLRVLCMPCNLEREK